MSHSLHTVNAEPTIAELANNACEHLELADASGFFGMSDEDAAELATWTDQHTPEVGDMDDEHVDLLMAEADASRAGLAVFKLTSPGFVTTYEAAASGFAAIRAARQRWARGGTSFKAECIRGARVGRRVA